MHIKTISLFLLSAFITAACTSSTNKKGEPLFNGNDFTGWRFYKNRDSNSWEIVDGMLHCKPFDGNEKRADLITTQQFKNFELTWEWKLPAQGNSGVMFNVVEDFDEPYLSGPEYQMLDDTGYPGKVEEWQKTGSNYGMHAANDANPQPIGEWNKSAIVVNQNHVEHWLNGKKVVAYELGSTDWNERKATSKWNEAAGYGASVQGHIAIQDHGSEVWVKNIRILKIE